MSFRHDTIDSDLVLGISDLVRFTPVWSDLVIRVTVTLHHRALLTENVHRHLLAVSEKDFDTLLFCNVDNQLHPF